jgi:putative copper export protein
MRILQQTLIWVHVLSAATWFGAMVFFAAVLVPALRGRHESERRPLIDATGRRFRAIVWPLFALLIGTGTAQLWFRGYRWADLSGPMWEGAAGHALAVKLVLFALALTVAAIHDFVIGPGAVASPASAAEGERRRRLASLAGRASLLLAASIIAAAVSYARGGIHP